MIWYYHLLKKDFIKTGFASHLMNRLDSDTLSLHRCYEIGDAVVFVVLVCPRQQQHPFGKMTEAGPDLAAIDYPVVAVLYRAGLQGHQIRTGAWLAEALTPDVFASEYGR